MHGSARQSIIYCEQEGSEPPSRNEWNNGKAHPGIGELSLPKHDVSEGFLPLVSARSKYLALSCMSLDCNIICVSGSTLSQHGLVSE